MLALGQTVGTPAALSLLEGLGIHPSMLLFRHANGDWGDISDKDKAANDAAAAATGDNAERVLSVYEVAPDQKVWIITEWDRSVTTLLLPSEY